MLYAYHSISYSGCVFQPCLFQPCNRILRQYAICTHWPMSPDHLCCLLCIIAKTKIRSFKSITFLVDACPISQQFQRHSLKISMKGDWLIQRLSLAMHLVTDDAPRALRTLQEMLASWPIRTLLKTQEILDWFGRLQPTNLLSTSTILVRDLWLDYWGQISNNNLSGTSQQYDQSGMTGHRMAHNTAAT